MNILESLKNALGQGASQSSGQSASQGSRGDSGFPGARLQGMLGQLFGDPKSGPGLPIFGGLIGALFGRSTLGGAAGGALLMKGYQLFSQYQERMKQEAEKGPDTQAARNYIDTSIAPSTPDERARRLIKAVVYAANSDGHIDDAERQAIGDRVRGLNLGAEGERLIQEAMQEQVDPKRLASNVKTPEEALEIFTVSCAVLHSGGFMVTMYLKELAKELAIPDDVRDDLISKISASE